MKFDNGPPVRVSVSLLTSNRACHRHLLPTCVLEIWSKAHRVRVRGAQLENTCTRTASVIPGPIATATIPSIRLQVAVRLLAVSSTYS